MVKSSYIVILITLLLAGCGRIGNIVNVMEEKPFGIYQDSLNDTRMRKALHEVTVADTSSWKADILVKHRYDSLADTADKALWIWLSADDGLSDDADDFVRFMEEELPRHGLAAEAFCLPEIEQDVATVRHLAFDSLGLDINEVLPRLDYNLSKAYVKYVTGMRYGFMQPAKLLNRLYQKTDGMTGVTSYAHLYDYVTAAPNYDEALEVLSSDNRMEHLRASLPANIPLYSALQEQLTSTTDGEKRWKVLTNMERCRWRIKHPTAGERRVMVNIPSQHLWAIAPDTMLTMKVAVGAWDTKTPLLCSEIAYMQVNPEWSLPPKIAASDFTRHAGDSAWFARHRYFAVHRGTGDTINIAHMGSEGFKNAAIRFVQRGGQGNALGRIVFRFSNSFSIYLHDTNSPGVFGRDRRTVSHGCVRIERPYDLAIFLLPGISEWTRDCLRISMDMQPTTERGMRWLASHRNEQRPYRLLTYHKISPRVPIYIMYYTMYPNPQTGVMETFPDIYGYDKPVYEKIQSLFR